MTKEILKTIECDEWLGLDSDLDLNVTISNGELFVTIYQVIDEKTDTSKVLYTKKLTLNEGN